MNSAKTGVFLLFGVLALLAQSCSASELEEFEELTKETNRARKEFDNYTEICFKQFKSSMVKLAVLFLDPSSETTDDQLESKCWVKCMMEQFKFIKIIPSSDGQESGEIVSEKMMERVDGVSQGQKTKLSQIIAHCENYSKPITDVCGKAFGFARCVFDSYRGTDKAFMVPAVPVAQPAILVSG